MAQTTNYIGADILRFTDGEGVDDDDVVFEFNSSLWREFTLQSTDGAMDVFVSLDGEEFSTAPLSLIDLGATTSDPVVVTAADRTYAFFGVFAKIRVQQNGAVAVAGATIMGRK